LLESKARALRPIPTTKATKKRTKKVDASTHFDFILICKPKANAFCTDTSNTMSDSAPTTTGQNDSNGPPTSGTNTAENRPGPSDATSGPETGDPSSGQKPEQKQQGADKPTEEPNDSSSGVKVPHSDAEREELMKKGEFPRDPNDHSGEPMKMHDASEQKKERSDSVAQEGGDPHGGSKGTGTEYVKSTGLAADGGDFDVTKPGAGKEASRE
jgi:hypothetical protein